jgi:cytochrome c biogenesis protein CcmG/thiol:disulfide interchange protein DsbE
MKRILMLLPLALFLAVALFLYRGLYLNPTELPSALIDKPFPVFSLPAVSGGQVITQADLQGQPALVNVWATWCPACRAEHPFLTELRAQGVRIIGVNYKDDNAAAQKWLVDLHDPYQLNIDDAKGSLGLDLGVYGAPETFLVDKHGIIRHKYVGVIDVQVWREQLAGLYQGLVDEARP